jgi:hypothetical protein
MIDRKDWVYDSELCEWRCDDFAYPISVAPDIDGKFIATLWIEHPGVRTFRNGDWGCPPDFEDRELGSFLTLDYAKEVAEVAALELEGLDAEVFAEWEAASRVNGGLDAD